MLNLKTFVSKNNNAQNNMKETAPVANSDKIISSISNWYTDRYNAMVVQRNLLLVLLILCITIVLASVVVVGNISSTFKIQPFVIEVEEKTGVTNIVNPLARQELTGSEVLNKYFLMKYIKARESYNSETWRYNYFTVVRLLSDPGVYSGFKRFVNTSSNSPVALYGGSNVSTYVVFRSIQFFPPAREEGVPKDSKAVIRFTIFPEQGGMIKGGTGNRIHKILTITYKYEQTEMNDDERSENPLGFYVTSYRDDIENEVAPGD